MESVVRIAAVTVLLLTALLVARDLMVRDLVARDVAIRPARGSWRQGVAFGLCALGVSGFVAGNVEAGALAPEGVWRGVCDVLGGWVAVWLWLFVRSIYEDGFRFGQGSLGGGLGVAAAWMGLSLSEWFPGEWRVPGAVMLAFGLGLVAHMVWVLLSGREGDLRAWRRESRLWVAAGLVAMLLADLLVDVVMGTGWRPQGFLLAQNVAILGVVAGIAGAMLGARPIGVDSVGVAFVGRPSRPSSEPMRDPKLAIKLARLVALMEDERVYLEPSLRLRDVAARLGVSDVEARALIRDGLGVGHFRAFLNGYRVAHAKDLLADGARAGDKIIAVGFDSGFASLASFQRAFKAEVGVAPGVWRRGGRDVRSEK